MFLNVFESIFLPVLYWYSFELVDASTNDLHFGISSFNTMLAGTVALFDPHKSELPNTIIVRFVHPTGDKGKNDYSYGILVDTKSAVDHYSSGWIIYQDACGDYSGFSNSERLSTEALIDKYYKRGQLEIRELLIPLKELKAFTLSYDRVICEKSFATYNNRYFKIYCKLVEQSLLSIVQLNR